MQRRKLSVTGFMNDAAAVVNCAVKMDSRYIQSISSESCQAGEASLSDGTLYTFTENADLVGQKRPATRSWADVIGAIS